MKKKFYYCNLLLFIILILLLLIIHLVPKLSSENRSKRRKVEEGEQEPEKWVDFDLEPINVVVVEILDTRADARYEEPESFSGDDVKKLCNSVPSLSYSMSPANTAVS